MAWTIKGEFVEACSCNMLCPCWYGVQDLMIMDQGWCASPWLVRVEEGENTIEMRFLPEDGVYWRQALLLSMFVVFGGLIVLPSARRVRAWARSVARRPR